MVVREVRTGECTRWLGPRRLFVFHVWPLGGGNHIQKDLRAAEVVSRCLHRPTDTEPDLAFGLTLKHFSYCPSGGFLTKN